MDRHPLSKAWPDMLPAEKEALREDMKKNGVLEPVVQYDGMVLDGWHRYAQATAAGIECPVVEYAGDDPVSFVISKNDMRRHISKQQRAVAVRLCLEWEKSLEEVVSEVSDEDEVDDASDRAEQVAADTSAIVAGGIPVGDVPDTDISENEAPKKPKTRKEGRTREEEHEHEGHRGVPHRKVAKVAGVSIQTARRAARELEVQRGNADAPYKEGSGETIADVRKKLENAQVVNEAQGAQISQLRQEAEVARETVEFLKEAASEDAIEELDVVLNLQGRVADLTAENQQLKEGYDEQSKVIESLKAENRSLRARILDMKEQANDDAAPAGTGNDESEA